MIEIIQEDPFEITDELAGSARNIMISYTRGRDCRKCVYKSTCRDDFKTCPAMWKESAE